MNKYLSLMLLLIVLLVVSGGCSDLTSLSSRWQAIVDVGIEKAEQEITRQIGDLDVKRQEIVNAIAASKQELTRLETARAKNIVAAQLAEEEIVGFEAEIQALQRQMAKLAEYLQSGEPLILDDGSVVDAEEMNQIADQLIWQFDLLEEKLALKRQTLKIYQDNAANADDRLSQGRAIVARMEGQLDLIDAQMETLEVYEEKPELMVDSGSFSEVIPEAQELIEETNKILAEERIIRETITKSEDRMGDVQEALEKEQPGPSNAIEALLDRAGVEEATESSLIIDSQPVTDTTGTGDNPGDMGKD